MDHSFIISAFIAGLLTFLAPCTLPLVPGFLGFISGTSLNEINNPEKIKFLRKKVFLNALAYVIGFSIVFIIMGTAFGFLGIALSKYKMILSRVGGVLVIIFGLYMMHVFKLSFLNFLNTEYKLNLFSKLHPGKLSSSFLFGAAFAFGWTPCVGPVLGAILTLALTRETVGHATLLLSIFSLGLATPFLIIASVFGSALHYIRSIQTYMIYISFVGGLFLVFIGILLVIGKTVVWNALIYNTFDFMQYQRLLEYL